MSAVINNDYQTSLLFKRFTGVAATQLDQEFSNEPYRAITNIFSRDIMIEEIPNESPITIFNLDNSAAWLDSLGSAPSVYNPTSQSFSELYPDTHLEFYKNVELTDVPGSNSRVWYKLDGSNNNILEDTINFKFDDVNSSYLMRVKYNNGTTYINNPINSYPLFWVLANQSGYLELYQTTSNLASFANIPNNPPKLSFIRYVGKKGLLNLDISGQQQVVDISGLDTDISNVVINLNNLNRMILPNGYVDVPGTDYDLCGNEVVRTYYTYNRDKMYIGYDNLPILDGSAVDHTQDPSFNNINDPPIILTVSGNTFMSGKLIQGFFDPPNTTGYQGVSGAYSHAEGFRTWVGGDYAHVEGNLCKIGPHFLNAGGGHYSHAEGDSNEIYTLFSHAEGRNNVIRSSSNWSHVEGRDNLIDSNSSYVHAEGRDNIASSNSLYSHLEGSGNTIISAEASHVEGAGNTIRANLSHAEGFNNTVNASAIYAHIEGSGNIVFGLASHAEGTLTSASGDYSHAEGLSTDASGLAAHAEGRFSEAFGLASHTEGISTRAWGDYSHAEGSSTTAYVSGSHAEGYQTDASGGWSHAEGYQTKTFGLTSHSEGLTTRAWGAYSHAEGKSSQSFGQASHVEGCENIITSTGECSHAEGRQNDISGIYCHAEGFNNNIGENSTYCHAEGISNNIPLGVGSHVEGTGNLIEVTSFPAHAEGAFNKVASLGLYAHAEGKGTIIDTEGGHSSGLYNDLSKNVIMVVGCGTDNNNRADAFYIDTSCTTNVNNQLTVSGDVFITGDLSANGIIIRNLDLSCSDILNADSINFCQNITIDSDISTSSIQIGYNPNITDNSNNIIAIGTEAGKQSQYKGSIAIGEEAGKVNQGLPAFSQSSIHGDSIAIGKNAGQTNQERSIAIGPLSGQTNQRVNSIAIGTGSGITEQGTEGIAIGTSAAASMQGEFSIAIGNNAGSLNQGEKCIAIGKDSGSSGQHDNSIILNATGNTLNSDNTDALYVAPIRGDVSNNKWLYYNETNKEITYSAANNITDDLSMNCFLINDVSGIFFCDGTYIGQGNSFDISSSQILKIKSSETEFYVDNEKIMDLSSVMIEVYKDISMNGNKIYNIGDATDLSGVPSLGQVQALAGSGGFWTQIGSKIYYNTGNVGIGTTNPLFTLDVDGETNIASNAFVSTSANQSVINADKNLYTRNTNLIDTLKISFDTFYKEIWNIMADANLNGQYISPSTGVTYNLTSPNPGKAAATPTFSSAWGPCVIPIAYLDINQNYLPTPFDPAGGQVFQTAFRPFTANTSAYFTIKFSHPYDNNNTSGSVSIDWKTATLYRQYGGTNKSGVAAIPEQTITFVAGYTDNFKREPGDDYRKPKPFIKVISTNIPNMKNLTGITTPDGITAIDINLVTQNMKYYGYTPNTPKIGGLVRIILAESCPGVPADKHVANKAWLMLEQQWNAEPWQQLLGVNNTGIIQSLVADHIIDVRMYANNLGDLNNTRQPPNINEYNTDWQLVLESQIQSSGIYSWEKFVLPMGNFANPAVFNTPTIVPPNDVPYTLMVGGTECPNPITGFLDGTYPPIIPGANLWEVWLNLKDWAYGITTTEEVFENNVDIYGHVIIEGKTDTQTISATDITCNNLDALNSIDVGPNQKLTITENKIISTTAASNPTSGLEIEANNMYMNFAAWSSAGGSTPSGLYVKLGDSTSNTQAQIRDFAGVKLFMVEGSGLMQTQQIWPFKNMTYDIGYKGNNPNQDLRYKNLYIGNIDASGDITGSGDITCTDICCNDITATSLSATGAIDGATLSATGAITGETLTTTGAITGEQNTKFVEYKKYTDQEIGLNAGWYCIATCEGSQDNARGLFIIDDDTSGRREQIILYAGTSYARGNYINVIAHNWYNGPHWTEAKIERGFNLSTSPPGPSTYDGVSLYFYISAYGNPRDINVRLYQNTRAINTGGVWQLTANPITYVAPVVASPISQIGLTMNTSNPDSFGGSNSVSSLDTVFYGDVSFNGDVNINNFNLVGQLETTSDSPVSITDGSPPYVWGTNYIQQVNPSDPYLLGSYKQIRSALFIWSGDEGISYGPPNNTSNPISGFQSLTPPCQGGGELLKLGTPQIWDLPSANYQSTYDTFTIPDLASRTMMTVELSIDIWYDSTNASRVNTIFFWLGKNGGPNPAVDGGGTGPAAYRMATHMPSYFGTTANEPTFCHTASITLLGSEGNPSGPSALLNDFDTGDTFYLTAQCMGSPSFPRYKSLRVKVTWEAVN